MSWLSRFSLAQRALIGLMSIVAIVFGAIAIPQLKQQLFPSIELPMVSVLAPYQGASPDVVEKQVVEPLESNLKAVDGLTSITSTASEGMAVVMASFDYGDESTKQLVADVQQAVNRARAQLPDSVDPQVIAGSTDDMPTVVLAAASDKDPQALADQLERTVVPALEGIEGVGQVSVSGVQDLQVSVTPDERKLAAAGLTTMKLAEALRSGGGTIAVAPSRRTARTARSRSAAATRRCGRSRTCASRRPSPARAGPSASVTWPPCARRSRSASPSPVPTASPASPSWPPWTRTAAPSPSPTPSRRSCPSCAATSEPVPS